MIRTWRSAVRGRFVTALACVACVVIAGCGSSGSSSSQPSAGQGGSKSPIVIGTVVSESGSFASEGVGVNEFEQAWAKWVNAKGGINGHPVKIYVVDDATSPSVGVSRVQQLVNQDHVIALVGGYSTASETAFGPYLKQEKIPYIGSAPYNPIWTQNPVFYPVTMTVPDSLYSKAQLAKQEAVNRPWGAIVCAELPACDVGVEWTAESKTLDIPFAGLLKASASASDYSAQCLDMKQKKAAYVQIGTSPQVADRIIADCKQQGYNPDYGITTTIWDPSFLKLQGTHIYGDSFALPYFSNSPALANFHDIVNTYIHDDSWQSFNIVATFSALEVFRQAMSSVTAANPTSTNVMQAMTTLHHDNLNGLLANSIGGFNAGTAPQPALKCFFSAEIFNGKQSEANGGKPICNTN